MIVLFSPIKKVYAGPCSAVTGGANATISSDCEQLVLNSAGEVTVNSGVTVSGQHAISNSTNSSTTSLTINGTISSGDNQSSIYISSGSSFNTITNTGTISSGNRLGGAVIGLGIEYQPRTTSITNFINSGTISVGNGAIGFDNEGGVISSFTNSGTISTGVMMGFSYAIQNANNGLISTLTNTGTLSTGAGGIAIYNTGSVITTLDNLQGSGNSSGSLSYRGVLPTNYNIIINSTSQYGRLSVSSVTGVMNFGIYSNSVLARGSYTQVLSGIASSNLSNLTGTYNGYTWSLNNSSGNIWDLIVTGASSVDTQYSLATQARKLRGVFNSITASSNFANANTYDCNLFDQNNLCISAGGRYTTVDNPSANTSAAVVVLGYKVSPNIRIGGFLDQSINNNTASGIHLSNSNPMMGAFAVWNQNADGLGYQVKLANAYQDKDVTTIRDITGTSEAGIGKTDLNTQSYVGELSYAFSYQDSTLVRPYFALRYTNIKQDAYTEDTTASVTAPLTYAKLEDRSTTALMGMKINHALNSKTNLIGSLGIEQDLDHKVDQLSATGVSGLTSENFNNNIKRTRPVASAGAYYAVAKNQRVSGEVFYQQLPFQSTGSATAYFNYMIGF